MPRRPEPVDPNVSPWHLLGAHLRYWRDEVRDISQREAAALALCDDSDLSKWERGLTPPHPDTTARLDAVYGAGGRLAALHGFAAELDRLRRVSLKVKPCHDEEDEMERRAALRLLTRFGGGAVVPAHAVEAVLSGVNRAVGDRDGFRPDDWDETVWQYAYQLNTGRFGSIISDVSADLVEVGRLLDANPAESVRAGLLRTSAQLVFLLAEDLANVGAQGASYRSYRAAHHAAHASGDRDLCTWMCARKAAGALWRGRSEEAVIRLADHAIRLADGVPSAGLAVAYKTKASALAAQGDADGARAALRQVGELFGRLPGSTTHDPHLMWGFPETELAFGAAYVSALIGDKQEGQRAVDHALAVFPRERVYGITNVKLIQALGAIRHRDQIADALDHAVTAGQRLPVTAARRRITGQILQALPDKARALPAARELEEQTAA